MTRWEFEYCPGDTYNQDADVAAAGFISYDCEYSPIAYPVATASHVEQGMPVWAVFNPKRTVGTIPVYDVYYLDDYGKVQWLDTADGYDLTHGLDEIRWEDERWSDIEVLLAYEV